MNDFAFLLFTTQKYSSFNPPYFPKRTLNFFLNSIPACSGYTIIVRNRKNFDILVFNFFLDGSKDEQLFYDVNM